MCSVVRLVTEVRVHLRTKSLLFVLPEDGKVSSQGKRLEMVFLLLCSTSGYLLFLPAFLHHLKIYVVLIPHPEVLPWKDFSDTPPKTIRKQMNELDFIESKNFYSSKFLLVR